MVLEHAANVLRVAQIERSINLVQNVHGRRLEEQERQNERQRAQRLLPSTELREPILPLAAKRNLDLKPIKDGLALWRIELRHRARKQRRIDRAKVLVHLLPRRLQRLLLLGLKLVNHRSDLRLVALNDALLGHQILVLLLSLLKHAHHLFVDRLGKLLLLFNNLVKTLARSRGGACLEIVVRARLAKQMLLRRNPRILALHALNRAPAFFDFLAEALNRMRMLLDLKLHVLRLGNRRIALLDQLGNLLVRTNNRSTMLIDNLLGSLVLAPRGSNILGKRSNFALKRRNLRLGLLDLCLKRCNLLVELCNFELACLKQLCAVLGLRLNRSNALLDTLDLLLRLLELGLAVRAHVLHLRSELRAARIGGLLLFLGLDNRSLECRNRLFRGLELRNHLMVRIALEPVLEQIQLVCLELKLARKLGVLVAVHIRLVQCPAQTSNLVVAFLQRSTSLAELAQLGEHRASLRLGATGECACRVKHVSLKRHGLDLDILVECNSVCSGAVRAHKRATKHKVHGRIDLVGEADKLERNIDIVLAATHGLRSGNLGLAHSFGSDAVQRDDGDALLELALGKQRLARLLGVDNDIVQLGPCGDLDRGLVLGVRDIDQVGHKTLDARAIKLLLRIRVCEIKSSKLGRERIDDLVLGKPVLLGSTQLFLVARILGRIKGDL
eukprot:comp22126_c0_seq1/m.51648 comp22126_c0_seq1/g.51648  ORF comp22126_c0_seq1/g.51648 comp22126_c0_seq1/m.51648 type:complete len:670 (+) comp22126_c0_seq1:539-2548(+)